MTILITGSSGFSGRALIQLLINQSEQDIIGIARGRQPVDREQNCVSFIACDLLDAPRVKDVIADAHPDTIVHLAGLNRDGRRDDFFAVNVTGTRNLLEAARLSNPSCRILIVSSSAVYGYAGQKPINEETPAKPIGDYGESKAAQEEVVMAEYRNYDTQITIARSFNLVGPGQVGSYVVAQIIPQIIEIERGERKTLTLNETRSCRDFIDIRDVVRAYHTLVSHPNFGHVCAGKIFNIASGTAYAVSDVISLIQEITNKKYIVSLPENPPVVPIPFQQGDISRMQKVTGWQPEISLKQSLEDMIIAERSKKD